MRKKMLFSALCLSVMVSVTACGDKEVEQNQTSVSTNVETENTGKADMEEQETEGLSVEEQEAEKEVSVEEEVSSEEQETEEDLQREQETEEQEEINLEEQETQETVSEENVQAETQSEKKEINLQALESEGKPAYEKYYGEIVVLEDAEDFVGEWNRTNTASSYYGKIVIKNQNKEGFEFEGELGYYSHSGSMEGKAYYLSQNTAIYRYEGMGDEEFFEYVIFQLEGEKMIVKASAGSASLGFGANVIADGEYITGEPVYTNANILEETFTQEELDSLKNVLGEDIYEEFFVWPVKEGVVTVSDCTLENGNKATHYDVFVPTMGGYAFQLLMVENGDWYYLSESEVARYNTNVAGELDFPEYVINE